MQAVEYEHDNVLNFYGLFQNFSFFFVNFWLFWYFINIVVQICFAQTCEGSVRILLMT